MTVQELIEKLEQLPQLYPVVVDGAEVTEVTEVLIRDELFYTKDQLYDEGLVVKLY